MLTFTFTATHTHGVGAAITNTAFFSGALQAGSAAADFTAQCRAAITVQNGKVCVTLAASGVWELSGNL